MLKEVFEQFKSVVVKLEPILRLGMGVLEKKGATTLVSLWPEKKARVVAIKYL